MDGDIVESPRGKMLLLHMFESAKGPSFNLLTKTIGNMATHDFDFAC